LEGLPQECFTDFKSRKKEEWRNAQKLNDNNSLDNYGRVEKFVRQMPRQKEN
jgi:hypothetical protein